MKKSILLACVGCMVAATPSVMNAEAVYDAASITDYGCGMHRQPASTRSSDDEEESWQIEYSDGVLSITWIGYIADCCHEEYQSRLEIEGNNIVYYLTNEDGMCDCICSYDVTATFSGIEPGQYILSIFGTDVTAEVTIEEDCNVSIKHSQSGIQRVAGDNLMTISADGILHVAIDGAFTVDIYDASGLRCGRIDSTGTSEFNLKSLPQGIYTARLSSGTKESVMRFAR